MRETEYRRGEGRGSKGEREHEMWALFILASPYAEIKERSDTVAQTISLSKRVAMREQRVLDVEDLRVYAEGTAECVS